MKRLVASVIACAPFAARAEVLDKEPSLAFLLLAALSACVIAYSAARRLKGKLALLGLLPVLFFFPVLLEQLDPVMRQALLNEGGWAAAGFMDTLLRCEVKSEVGYGNKTAVQPGVQS